MNNKLPQPARPQGQVTHKPAASRLPLNRLNEAKVLNSQLGHHLRKSLFPAGK
jgi:hypothetical protein